MVIDNDKEIENFFFILILNKSMYHNNNVV